MKDEAVRVYTDGSCIGNPGPGGWGIRIRYPDGRVKEMGGGEPSTTNNRMEMQAVIEALAATRDDPRVLIVMDSEYVRKGVTSWLKGWKARGWMTSQKKPVLNQDLWKRLDALLRTGAEFAHTDGHAGDPDNERCDRIAFSFSKGAPVELLEGVDNTPCAPLVKRSSKPAKTGSRSSGSRAKGPLVYLSFVEGRLLRHPTWAECEAVVKGRKGALYKKCRGPEEVATVLKKWGLPATSLESD